MAPGAVRSGGKRWMAPGAVTAKEQRVQRSEYAAGKLNTPPLAIHPLLTLRSTLLLRMEQYSPLLSSYSRRTDFRVTVELFNAVLLCKPDSSHELHATRSNLLGDLSRER